MVYCSNCGKKNKYNAKYCYNCGKPLILEETIKKPDKPLKKRVLNGRAFEKPDKSSEIDYEYETPQESEKEVWGLEWRVIALGTLLLIVFYAIMLRILPAIAFIIGGVIAAFYVFSASKKGSMFIIHFPLVIIISLIITTLFSF
ncbi:MAG: zinc ribbon domain-containing protein [Methanobacteriaceae archaeon]|nr:zinc ribbon domain-containing protein [Methanobacteriaceae archaeon]